MKAKLLALISSFTIISSTFLHSEMIKILEKYGFKNHTMIPVWINKLTDRDAYKIRQEILKLRGDSGLHHNKDLTSSA